MINELPDSVLSKLRPLLRHTDIIAFDCVCQTVHQTFAPFATLSANILREREELRERRVLVELEHNFANTFLNRSYRSSSHHLPLPVSDSD